MKFSINIRQKIVLGMTVCLIAIGLLGGVSYHSLLSIETKVHFLEVAQDLSNTILEMRRYEKNFLLYGLPDSLVENRKYVQHGLEILDSAMPRTTRLEGSVQLEKLKEYLLAYQGFMASIDDKSRMQSPERLEESLRETGKNLVDLSETLVRFERSRILSIIAHLKAQLLISLLVFVLFGIALIPFVSRKIIQPLRVVETTTERISRGEFTGLPVLQTRDETQRVVEAFNRMVRELEKRQDQLVESKRLSSLGVLTSGVAHQLNNPLNNISTSCQIVLEELETGESDFIRKMLRNIEQEVQRARDIVRGLLEFSRVKEFSIMSVPLHGVIERALRLISSQIPPGIEVVRNIPEDLFVKVDSQRIQEVFLNLFMNAIDALARGPGQIKVSAELERGSGMAVIRVQDTGMGIPGENLGKIFDPFFSTKEVGFGTGLGLSIAYGIIKKHGGTIAAESQEGVGTTFFIRLPVDPQPPIEKG